MAHGRRALSENGGGANKQRAARGSRKGSAALPLKFFNVKTSERFVFKRRDKKCLTLSPRSSLIPVFIHFSDFFPEIVQATLTKCKALILGCERVVILKPNQVGLLQPRNTMTCTYLTCACLCVSIGCPVRKNVPHRFCPRLCTRGVGYVADGVIAQGKPMIDDIVWEGPGSNLPDRCWDRQGVILRTLDIVAYKVSLQFWRDTHTIARALSLGAIFGPDF